ncbi:TetR/AcrR family transcriptional regulator [Streptomyces sp. YJ-C3]
MTTEAKPSSRDRLLDAAAALAYREGVGVGIAELCKAAGVSKRSMYQLFESKDELLAESLKRRAPGFAERLRPAEGDARTPRERILYVFGQVEEAASADTYRGCPFLAVQVELKDEEHPASRVARRVKADLAGFFRDEAERGGAADPELLARQLMLVFDGASARAGIGADSPAGLVVPTVVVLLDAAGVG